MDKEEVEEAKGTRGGGEAGRVKETVGEAVKQIPPLHCPLSLCCPYPASPPPPGHMAPHPHSAPPSPPVTRAPSLRHSQSLILRRPIPPTPSLTHSNPDHRPSHLSVYTNLTHRPLNPHLHPLTPTPSSHPHVHSPFAALLISNLPAPSLIGLCRATA